MAAGPDLLAGGTRRTRGEVGPIEMFRHSIIVLAPVIAFPTIYD